MVQSQAKVSLGVVLERDVCLPSLWSPSPRIEESVKRTLAQIQVKKNRISSVSVQKERAHFVFRVWNPVGVGDGD